MKFVGVKNEANVDDEGLKEAYEEAAQHNWTREAYDAYIYSGIREQDEKGRIEKAQENARNKLIVSFYENGVPLRLQNLWEFPRMKFRKLLKIKPIHRKPRAIALRKLHHSSKAGPAMHTDLVHILSALEEWFMEQLPIGAHCEIICGSKILVNTIKMMKLQEYDGF